MTTRTSSFLGVIAAAIALTACGGDRVASTPAENTKAALESMFDIVKSKDREALAPYTVYRGRDKERKWKDASNYAEADEKRHVDSVFGRIEKLLLLGEPVFEKFESETESEGTWLVWHVTFDTKKVAMACLEIDRVIMLGDMD